MGKESRIIDGQPLSHHKKNKTNAFRLYQLYNNFKNKCENTFNPNYKDYGAKGVKMDIAFNDFYLHLIKEAKSSNIPEDKVVCSRLYKNESFSISNIIGVRRGENLAGRLETKNGAMPLAIADFKTKELLIFVPTTIEASKYSGVNAGLLLGVTRGQREQASGYTFRNATPEEIIKYKLKKTYRGV